MSPLIFNAIYFGIFSLTAVTSKEIKAMSESFDNSDISYSGGKFSEISNYLEVSESKMNSTELNQQANCKCINGKCVLNENGENVCKCPPEFSHYTPTECKECDCGEESSCTFSKGTYKRKTCVCKEGYWLRGSKCKICKCENGKCVEIEPGKTICQCPPEFSLYLHNECRACNCGKGKNCTFGSWNSAFREKEKVCICQEGSVDAKSTCLRGTCAVNDEGKNICQCRPGFGPYLGKRCKACECGEGSNCTFTGIWNTEKKCICKKGYKDENGTCVGPCAPNPCENGGTCLDISDSYRCMCPYDYTGQKCESKACICYGGTCVVNKEGERVCECPPEYGLDDNTCRACICGKGSNCTFRRSWFNSKTCICKEGYKEERGICIGTCDSNPCKNGGSCHKFDEEYKCTCKSPYSGKFCETGPCEPNPCQNGGSCSVLGRSFVCSCLAPYSGMKCEKNPCILNPCHNGGRCRVVDGDYVCSCLSPYSGRQCEKNPCSPNPCLNAGECVIGADVYICICENPYSGTNCERGPCSSDPCQNGGSCSVVEELYNCTCPYPYFGKLCEKSPCNPNPCKNHGKCSEVVGDYKCICKPPYFGRTCEKDLCSPNPCQNSGKCTVDKDGYVCLCKYPYSGRKCEIDPCGSNPCQNDGRCSVFDGKHDCKCPSPYFGKLCEKSPCNPNPCKNDGKCRVVKTDYNCSCKPPYIGRKCETECYCGKNSTCFRDEYGFKRCACGDGYLEIDGECKDACSIYPCVHGTCFRTVGKGVFCKCEENYKGISCDTPLENIGESKKQDLLFPILLGAMLLLTLVLFVSLGYVLCRKK